MSERLTLGYREATAPADSPLAPAGTEVRGHEFHRTVAQPRHGSRPAWLLRRHGDEGFVVGRVHASYLHLHWASQPEIARRFVKAAHLSDEWTVHTDLTDEGSIHRKERTVP